MNPFRILSLLLPLAALTVNAEESWTSLFNGQDLSGWITAKGDPPEKGWEVRDGCIYRFRQGGDLYTERPYTNFVFEAEWKISKGGNSGIKYRVADYGGKRLGPEYQVLDDQRHIDAKITPKRRAAGLYDIIAAPDDKPLNAVEEWNQLRIVADGPRLEHWLNGVKVVEVDTSSDAWREAVAASKFKGVEGFGTAPSGPLMLQDHGNAVWYRNLRIRELP